MTILLTQNYLLSKNYLDTLRYISLYKNDFIISFKIDKVYSKVASKVYPHKAI